MNLNDEVVFHDGRGSDTSQKHYMVLLLVVKTRLVYCNTFTVCKVYIYYLYIQCMRKETDIVCPVCVARFSKAIYQFDGGDPARELFVPRRFWGQQLKLGCSCCTGPNDF